MILMTYHVQDSAIEALKKLIVIDADCMWWVLHNAASFMPYVAGVIKSLLFSHHLMHTPQC